MPILPQRTSDKLSSRLSFKTSKLFKGQLYRYQPLEVATHIRVLHLDCNSNRSLRCSIETLDISQAKFIAMSYAWGSPEKIFKMTVTDDNGRKLGYIPLTASLYHALLDLRACDDINLKNFWIDQICINQDDLAERSRQVALMGSIYKAAMQVITYLGPKEPADEAAIRLIMRLYRICEAENLPNWQSPGQSYFPAEFKIDFDRNDPGLAGCFPLLFGPWTQRLWMIPENVLNRNTVMLRGNVTLPWISVAVNTLLFIFGPIPIEISQPHVSNLYAAGFTVAQLCKLRRLIEQSDQTGPTFPSILFQLIHFSNLSCSNPRDKLFALLNISTDVGVLDILPDYSKSTQDVFVEAAQQMIIQSGILTILSYVRYMRKPSPGSPSWVPAFHLGHDGSYVPFKPQHPADRIPSKFEFRADPPTLVLQGLIIDIIDVCYDLRNLNLRMLWEDPRKNVSQCAALNSALQELREYIGDADEADYAIAHALLQQPVTPESKQPHQMPAVQGFRALLGVLASNAAATSQGANHTPSEEEVHRIEGFIDACDLSSGTCLAMSKERRLCMVHKDTRPGDAVVLLAGGRVAYILRSIGTEYHCFVSDAYVHGVMNGEAVKDPQYENLIQEICLI